MMSFSHPVDNCIGTEVTTIYCREKNRSSFHTYSIRKDNVVTVMCYFGNISDNRFCSLDSWSWLMKGAGFFSGGGAIVV